MTTVLPLLASRGPSAWRRAVTVVSLVSCIAATTDARAEATSWVEGLRQERSSLQAEKAGLEQAVASERTAAERTRAALEKEVEELTRQLTRLRAANAAKSQGFAERERSFAGARQEAAAAETVARARAWGERKGLIGATEVPLTDTPDDAERVFAALSGGLVERAAVRSVQADVYGRRQPGRRLPVTRVGPVAAFAVEHGKAIPLEPLSGDEGWQTVTEPQAIAETPDGLVAPAVFYDPEAPHEHAPVEDTGVRAWLERGGLAMYPLALMGLVALFVALERLLQLLIAQRQWWAAVGRGVDDVADVKLQAGEPYWVLKPLHVVLAQRGRPRAEVEEQAAQAVLRVRARLRSRLTVLAVIAAAAPLLGLLGTVTGMIGTFRVITEHGTGDPELLSGGISQALLTTQLGLGIAIPTLLTHAILNRWTQRMVSNTELTALELMQPAADVEGRSESMGNKV